MYKEKLQRNAEYHLKTWYVKSLEAYSVRVGLNGKFYTVNLLSG